MKTNPTNDKFRKLYTIYLTEYILFKRNAKEMAISGELDEEIKDNYIYYLFSVVNDIKETNIYPIEIILEFIDLIEGLQERCRVLADGKELESLNKLFEVMTEYLGTVQNDDREIYFMEYSERYSNSKVGYYMRPVKDLEQDIINDYVYLSMIVRENVDLNLIGDDFPYFLNKLFVDFPEVKLCPTMIKEIIKILEAKDFYRGEDYIHFLKDKRFYAKEYGFEIGTFHTIHGKNLLKKALYSNDPKKTLENENPEQFYISEMYTCLEAYVNQFKEQKAIADKDRRSFLAIINYLRSHLKEYGGDYIHDFNDLYNQAIIACNGCAEAVDFIEKLKNGDKRLIVRILAHFSGINQAEKDRYVTATKNEIMKYYMDMNKKEDVTIDKKKTLMAIDSLFDEYPKMFFDENISLKTKEILDEFPSMKAKHIKRKISHIKRI